MSGSGKGVTIASGGSVLINTGVNLQSSVSGFPSCNFDVQAGGRLVRHELHFMSSEVKGVLRLRLLRACVLGAGSGLSATPPAVPC